MENNKIKAYASNINRDTLNSLIYAVTFNIVDEINKFDISNLLKKEIDEIKNILAEIINCTFVVNITFKGDNTDENINETIRLINKELSCTVLELPIGFPFPVRYLISEVRHEDNKLKMKCIMLEIDNQELKNMSLTKKEYVINKQEESFRLKKMTKKIN